MQVFKSYHPLALRHFWWLHTTDLRSTTQRRNLIMRHKPSIIYISGKELFPFLYDLSLVERYWCTLPWTETSWFPANNNLNEPVKKNIKENKNKVPTEISYLRRFLYNFYRYMFRLQTSTLFFCIFIGIGKTEDNSWR